VFKDGKARIGLERRPLLSPSAGEGGFDARSSPWMNVKQAASYAGCHEETIRRGYLAGFLKAPRFGKRGRRIHVADLECWLRDGARTREYRRT
jgi:excisionase family DNA binding protein